MQIPSDLAETLYTAVISDTLDDLGFPNQALRPFVRPLDETQTLVGRVRTGLYARTYDAPEDTNPYELEIKLIDDLKSGEIPLLACDGPTDRIAPWGELLTTAAIARGAVGCVTDGLIRDVRQIRAANFPVFHGGIGPLDSKGRGLMVEMDSPVEIAGAVARSGDIAFGDVDGIVIVPQDVAEEVFERAHDKVTRENHTRDELLASNLLADVYAKYGTL